MRNWIEARYNAAYRRYVVALFISACIFFTCHSSDCSFHHIPPGLLCLERNYFLVQILTKFFMVPIFIGQTSNETFMKLLAHLNYIVVNQFLYKSCNEYTSIHSLIGFSKYAPVNTVIQCVPNSANHACVN